MTDLRVPVSVGELIDKITILRIKQRRITDSSKLQNISKELTALIQVCVAAKLDLKNPLVAELETTNERLWQIEDDIRDLERKKSFAQPFIELARAVYFTNDRRFNLKSELNNAFGSSLKEEKSYQDYM